MTAEKGLAGAFNSNVDRAPPSTSLATRSAVAYYTVGNKARNAVRRMGVRRPSDVAAWRGSKIDTAREVAQAT